MRSTEYFPIRRDERHWFLSVLTKHKNPVSEGKRGFYVYSEKVQQRLRLKNLEKGFARLCFRLAGAGF